MASKRALLALNQSAREQAKAQATSARKFPHFEQFLQHCNIVLYQTRVDLKQESSRFFLGIVWWLLDPLMMILIFVFLAYAGIRFVSIERIVLGIGLWKLFAGSVSSVGQSIMSNRGLMNQVALPKWIFPVQAFLYNLVKFAFLLFVLFAYLWAWGAPFSVHYLSFPVVLLIYILVSFSLSLFIAVFVPFLPDLRFLISNMVMLLFWVSGIFFDISTFPPDVQRIFYLNPFAVIIKSFKNALLLEQWPMWHELLVITLVFTLVLMLAFRLLHRFSHTYPKLQRG